MMARIGEKLLALRKKKALTQVDLATASNVPQSAISAIENCTRSPELATLEKLAAALGTSVNYFWDDAADSSSDDRLTAQYMKLTKRQRFIIDSLLDELNAKQNPPEPTISEPQPAKVDYPVDRREQSVSIPARYANDHYFIVQAQDDSMLPRIHDNDYVIVQRNTPPDPGQLALIHMKEAAPPYVIKVPRLLEDCVELNSSNPSYPTVTRSLQQIVSMERIVFIIPQAE